MTITVARASRLIDRAQLPFEELVADPRDRRGKRHRFQGLLSLLVVSFARTRLGFRDVEALSEDLGPQMRRRLRVNRRRVSDTAFYELLPRLDPEQFRPVLWTQVRRDLDSKAIRNDLFPGGVLSFDGKGAGSGMGEAPNDRCRGSVCDKAGTKCWDAFALRACLTSATSRPVLDQQYILRKAGEASTFPEVFDRAVTQFPKLFRYVTWDAGLTSAANTRLVRSTGKHYVGAIKANFNKLFPLAKQLLAGCAVAAATCERTHGKTVRRELRRVEAPQGFGLADLTELWGVRQVTTTNEGKVDLDDRIFAVSIPAGELSAELCLRLVRLHWGIENGPNWSADMLLSEDTQTPCTVGDAVLVLGWLRLLAYNLLSVFRAHLPLKDRSPQAWRRCADLLYQALLRFEPTPSLDGHSATIA